MSSRVIFPREQKPEGKGHLLESVKTFTDAHSSFGKSEIPRDRIRSNPVPAPRPTSKFVERKYPTPKFSPRPFPTPRTCFLCNRPGHVARNCMVGLVSRN